MPWLVAAVLSIPLAGMLWGTFSEWHQARVEQSIEVSSARKLVALASQVEKYVHANYGTLIVGLASAEIPIAALTGQDLLPAGFGAGDAMKRGLRIWAIHDGNRIRVVTTQVVADFDDRWPGSAQFEAVGEQALGIVDGSGVLRGPTINEDLTAFQAASGGDPRQYALAVYQVFDRETICGDYLFRRVRAGCPDGSVMETDLQLGGNDLLGVGRLEVENLEVSDGIEVGGNFRIDGDLAVGRSVRMEGTFAAPGGVTFDGDAEFTGTVNADGVVVSGLLEADSADVGQGVTAATINATGNLTAAGATVTTLNAGSGDIRVLAVGSCSGC